MSLIKPTNRIMYSVSDDSMSGDRILPGCDVTVEIADSGAIVEEIALVKTTGGLKLRRIEKHRDAYILKPSNPKYQIEKCIDVEYVGRVVSVAMTY